VALGLVVPCIVYSTIVIRDLEAMSSNFDSAYFSARLVVELLALIMVVLLTVLAVHGAYDVKKTWMRFVDKP
jgi:trehalose-6-phosphatase